ncbi:MAG: nickel pincer cofactor biosynthesis protein LarC [Acidobacteria bacterium]|nr:nickel pincer cofactor biosynthesis protein LarC [Acidobacteriota bacterium]
MARVLYLDCYSGAAGDMLLGALLDAGLPFELLRAALGSLALDDECTVSVSRVSRSGIAASQFVVTETAAAAGGHRHRHLPGITKLVERSALSAEAKARANRLFRRLAETEAAIHQMPVEKVHLHEVGALDSIVDIVGGVFGLEWFAADRIVVSPLNVGSGTIECEHGTLPVPAPATAALLSGVPVYAAGPPGEKLTPTGALLVTEFADAYGVMPAMRIDRIGYGAGTRDPQGYPNVLRVLVGESDEDGPSERILVVECEIDDMNPQLFGVLMDRLYDAGAVDVFYTAVQMKKNRPGTHVTILAPPTRREAVATVLFRESTTIGLRYRDVDRHTLPREQVLVTTAFGDVRCKVARHGTRLTNVAPEFDDCVRLSVEHGVPVKDVQAAAMQAYRES